MIETLLLALLAGCPHPVYLTSGPTLCSETPVRTAFGKVTWRQQGRIRSASAEQVDLRRTLAAARQADSAPSGSFSMAKAAGRSGGAPGRIPPRTAPPSTRRQNPAVTSRPARTLSSPPAAGGRREPAPLSRRQRLQLRKARDRARHQAFALGQATTNAGLDFTRKPTLGRYLKYHAYRESLEEAEATRRQADELLERDDAVRRFN